MTTQPAVGLKRAELSEYFSTAWASTSQRYNNGRFERAEFVRIGKAIEESYWRFDAPDEGSRRYHDLAHPVGLLMLCQQHFALVDHDFPGDARWALRMAIFYHDVFMVPGGKTNELFSARRMQIDLGAFFMNAPEYWLAQHMIHASATHDPNSNPLVQFFLDLDLAVLADEAASYDGYVHDVRKEYSRFKNDEWRLGRMAFVTKMLRREFLYGTKPLRELWEDAARANLRREMEQLRDAMMADAQTHSQALNGDPREQALLDEVEAIQADNPQP